MGYKKIFMFEPSYLSLKGDGLHERRIAEEISKDGAVLVTAFQVVLPPFHDFMKKIDERPNNATRVLVLPVIWPLYFFGFYYGLLFSLIFSAYRLCGKKAFDAIYVRDNSAAFVFNLFQKIHQIPVCFKLQSFTADEFLVSGLINNLIARIMLIFERIDVLKSDLIFVPSENFKQELLRRYNFATAKNIYALSVGVDLQTFSVQNLGKLKPQNSPFTLGYFGSLNAINDVDCLLEAVNRLKLKIDVQLIIATQTDCSLLMKQIKSLELEEHVKVVRSPYKLIPKLISEVDVIVVSRRKLSSTDLVLPLKLLEGGAAKKPVIFSKTRIAETSLSDGTNVLLYEPGNAQDLSLKVIELYNNFTLRKSLGEALFMYVQDFDWHSIGIKLRNRLNVLSRV